MNSEPHQKLKLLSKIPTLHGGLAGWTPRHNGRTRVVLTVRGTGVWSSDPTLTVTRVCTSGQNEQTHQSSFSKYLTSLYYLGTWMHYCSNALYAVHHKTGWFLLSLTCGTHGQIMSNLSRKSQIPWYFRSPPHSSRSRPGMAKHVTRTLVAYGCTWSLARITVHVHYTPLEITSKPSAESTTKCLEKFVLPVLGAFSFMAVKGIRTRILEPHEAVAEVSKIGNV